MKVLIVYENIPESTDLFVVDANEAEVADLKLAHGEYINSSEGVDIEAAMERISIRLGSEEATTDERCYECKLNLEDKAKWNGCGVTGPVIIDHECVEMVIVTGFYL